MSTPYSDTLASQLGHQSVPEVYNVSHLYVCCKFAFLFLCNDNKNKKINLIIFKVKNPLHAK